MKLGILVEQMQMRTNEPYKAYFMRITIDSCH